MSVSTVTFTRIWSNKHQECRLNAVSIWRPVVPQGYVAVGDCLVSGTWTAPRSTMVLRWGAGEDGIVKRPLVCVMLDVLCFWS
jgi:hypothetical protein